MDGGQRFSHPGPLRVLSHEGQRYLCFCDGGSQPPAPLRLHVTNACEFWSGDIFPEQLDRLCSENGQDPPEDSASKLRQLLEHQTPALTICDGASTLQFQKGTQALTFDLSKDPLPESRKQLQDLLFGLVEQLQTLQRPSKEGAGTANAQTLRSPEKNALSSQFLFPAGLSPPKSRAGPGQTAAKKRLPGESLINPGFKSKKIPTGVDFDDP